MGSSASWLAVRGKPRSAVLEWIGLAATGMFERVPESPVVGMELAGRWYVVRYDFFAGELEGFALQISPGCEVVLGRVDEAVMCSTASGWRNGCELWSVMHDSQQGPDHLQVRGSPPPEFPFIRDRLLREQARSQACDSSEDYLFDIPLVLAETITVFRYDETPEEASSPIFEVLQRQVRVIPGWGPDAILAALKNQQR